MEERQHAAWTLREDAPRSARPGFRAKHFVKNNLLELPGLSVTLDRLVHAPELPAPPDKPHSFVYFISIHNGSDRTITIKGRKWVVTNSRNEVTAIEGDGVVGEFPVLKPGEKFSYNSRHILDTTRAIAQGSYWGADEAGVLVVVRIPTFEMVVPEGRGS
ncbi:MAG: ApaG domain-containing protein [Verrucomicrobia bacterium]|nr:ApaG domain-containing protein [Verrucomicrobiota bacterium]